MRPNHSGIVLRVVCASLALLMISAILPAAAAKVYRCGNVFQDQPCTTDKETRAAEKPAPARDAPARAPALAATKAPTPDRLVVEPPRGVAIEVRR